MGAAALITREVQRLHDDFQLSPVTASEIEFYLHGSESGSALPAFWEEVLQNAGKAGIPIFNKGKEDGLEQHEIALALCPDPLKTTRDTKTIQSIISENALHHGMKADFFAKPFADRPGSGLHIHVHLSDAAGKNIFYKDDIIISDTLRYSIGGMLAWLPDCMSVFAPHAESYARFIAGSNAPTTVSWGANNRTVAIRLPQAAHENKHIEHRVSGVDADPALAMAVILAAMHYGLKNKCDPGAQIFGNASLPMYALSHLPASLEESKERLRNSKLIADYFSVSDLLPVP